MESFRPYSLQYLIDGISGPVELIAPELQGGYFPKDNTGMALWNPGKSAAVFPFLIKKQRKAIKIWYNHENKGKKEKYEAIKGLFNNISLPYFSNAQYISNALNIKDTPNDVLVMDWVGRQNIKEYIIANIHEVQKLHALAVKILELHKELNENGIAHGHLNSSNIYIDSNNELQLIDYDTVFIKGVTASEKVATTYSDYSHPSQRRVTILDERADYFSALVLYLGVKAIAENTALWGRYSVGTRDGFIFTQEDFTDLSNCNAYADIKRMADPLLDKLLNILQLFCTTPGIDTLQPFYEYLLKNLPLQPGTAPSVQPTQNTAESIKTGKANDNGGSKKVSVILPNQKDDNPSLPEKTQEPLNNPTPSWITDAQPLPQDNKEQKKAYVVEERALSNIWIHKNDNADVAIVKVFNTNTASVEKPVKEIESFSVPAQPQMEEKLTADTITGQKKTGIRKKGILITLLTAIVVTSTAAGIYLANIKGINFSGFANNNTQPVKETVITPIEKATVLAIEPSREDSSNTGLGAGAEINADTNTTAANATPAVSNISDSAKAFTVKEPVTLTPVASKESTTPEKQKEEPIFVAPSTVSTVTFKTEKAEEVIPVQPIPKVIAKKEKTIPTPKKENDILDDISPSKGFNTGIKTKN